MPADFLLPAILFILSFVYFYGFCDYAFFYQENLTLFLFSRGYLSGFLIKPGGLLEYAGNFLAQGYYNTLYGALVLAVVNYLYLSVFMRIGKKLSREGFLSLRRTSTGF
jgi:hypothetical protein